MVGAVFYANVLIGGSRGDSDADSEHRPIADWYTSHGATSRNSHTLVALHAYMTKHLFLMCVALSDGHSDRRAIYKHRQPTDTINAADAL